MHGLPLRLPGSMVMIFCQGMDYATQLHLRRQELSFCPRPLRAGTRITVYDVLKYLAGGMTEADILSDFPTLTAEAIRACLEFAAAREKRLAALRAQSPRSEHSRWWAF